jgi:hypothetical protein
VQFETIFVVHLDTCIKNSTESNGKTNVKEVKSTKIIRVVKEFLSESCADCRLHQSRLELKTFSAELLM